MKVIVVAGGGRRVGKTTLAKSLVELLPDSITVKLGTHPPRADNPILFLPHGTSFAEVRKKVGNPQYLIIESGGILDDPELEPNLVVFLPTPDGREDKPGSERRRSIAHMVRGELITRARAAELSSRLGVGIEVFEKLAEAAGVTIEG